MPIKPLDRLMFAQGGLCFFCNMPLPKSEASIEHLVPSSRAGSNSDDNCVVCCKAVNSLFGSMSLKEKIRVVLNQNGKFICPNGAGSAQRPSPNRFKANSCPVISKPAPSPYTVILADLKKRGATRPRKIETLKNTIRAVARDPLTDAQLEALLEELKANDKITVDGTKVIYSL